MKLFDDSISKLQLTLIFLFRRGDDIHLQTE